MNRFYSIFEDMSKVQDRSVVWNNFLDFSINACLLQSQQVDYKGNESQYMEMLESWLLQLNEDLESKPYSDRLGLFYEELVTSHVKSKSIGQFYTPVTVTDLMNKLSLPNNDLSLMDNDIFINDCACGSARMLLSAHVKTKGECICIGQDLDETSCKMAVLNFWSHGVRGSILHMDTLTGEFYNAWRVNNYLYYGLPVPHIELVSQREAYDFMNNSRSKHFNA